MKVCVLASGSSGNCTYIEVNDKKILIDIGISNLSVTKKLAEIGVSSDEIDYVFITHSHTDHTNGLKVFCKKNNPSVYMSDITFNEIDYSSSYNSLSDNFMVEELLIETFKLSHDASNIGYVISYNEKSIAYITDTGYLNRKYIPRLKNKSIYVFESNHDINLLMDHPNYPYHTKQRILGSKGHLSNADASLYLTQLIGTNTKQIILVHLSERSNKEDLARNTLLNKLNEKNIDFNNIIVADSRNKTELVEV